MVGGTNPAALAADWLTAAWDQNAGLYVLSPAAAVVEEVAGGWLAELLGLPAGASVGFVTGGQAANTTALAAARHEVLRRAGWDVETGGLAGAPPVRVLAGAERHGTVDRAVRLLGLGTGAIEPVAADGQGRMRPDALAERLAAGAGPAIVCAQVGNVNSGAVDPVGEICRIAAPAGAWVHVDGAFGLWAAASPGLRPLLAGVERADSWATDAHKWLNVPYDSGLVFCADPAAAPRRDGRAGQLPGARGRRRAGPGRLQPRVLAAGARLPGVRGAARAGPARASPSWWTGAARWRAGSPTSWPPAKASRCSTRSCSTRCWSASATTTR